MSRKDKKTKLRAQVVNNIKRFGWKSFYRDDGLKKAYRYVYNIPDHIPDRQVQKWMEEVEGEKLNKSWGRR